MKSVLRSVPLFMNGLMLALLLSACAGPSQPINWAHERNMRQPDLTETHKLLLEQEGWQVWRRVKGRVSRCVAVKPANGRRWPQFDWQVVPVSGGAGFYMLWEEKQTQPYFGFYGAHAFGKVTLAWRDGVSVLDTNNRDAVLSWQGETLDFEVTTQPAPEIYAESLTLTGQLDFSGVQQAYAALEQCHEWRL